jgi:deazaflavin-dependent oxidoreductase (nitroreductase family)
MPIPAPVASFNRAVTNHLMRPLAVRSPGFAVLHHVGRRSGRVYDTPVNAFRSGDEIVIALTYGPDTDWLRNVVAADGCAATRQGRRVELVHPHRLSTADGMAAMPAPVRVILRLIGVTEFLALERTAGQAPS